MTATPDRPGVEQQRTMYVEMLVLARRYGDDYEVDRIIDRLAELNREHGKVKP